ncbi:MAG: class IV adenylate cyclase [bacterium]|nr:class IV adenylate cyclase [bacterium]
MKIEYEATFIHINKEEIRNKLKDLNATLLRPEFLQKRVVFNMPEATAIRGGWLRVRDEGGKITMTLKVVDGDKIENQREILLNIDDFQQAEELLTTLGCAKKAYQENNRELWKLDGVEITIDEWPFLEPFVEVEGDSEESVKNVSEKLGFNYRDALFGTVTTLYAKKYGIAENVINNEIPKIVFEMENPFLTDAR